MKLYEIPAIQKCRKCDRIYGQDRKPCQYLMNYLRVPRISGINNTSESFLCKEK